MPRKKVDNSTFDIKSENTEKKQCHIHNKVGDWVVATIRENVCFNEEPLIKLDGKYYCFLHLPSKDKDNLKFQGIIQDRIKAVEDLLLKSEQLSEVENTEVKSKIKYDFRFVWFPRGDFANHSFQASADFSGATFDLYGAFISCVFLEPADFSHAVFNNEANFSWTKFSASNPVHASDFTSTQFLGGAFFKNVKFECSVLFKSTLFDKGVDCEFSEFQKFIHFIDAKFYKGLNLRHTTFGEKSEIYFSRTKFSTFVSFFGAVIDGFMEFDGSEFLDFDQEDELFKNNQVVFLSLVETKINKPERISFNSMKLRPCWFVGTEARSFVFNDIDWKNLGIDVDRNGLNKEFDNLCDFNIQRPKVSLIKACNQLADNAEANRRFEEAKQFRKQGIALREHQCHVQDSLDFQYKKIVRQLVCKDYPVVNEDGGNYYCLWHNPDKNKAEIFLKEYEKVRDAGQSDFQAVNFPIALRFYKKLPEKLNFSHAIFHRRVVFHESEINRILFDEARFEKTSELIFEHSICKGKISFWKTVFDGKLFLNGIRHHEFFEKPQKALSLQDARFENPQAINFRSLRLRPHYFVGVDASEFVFHDCKWKERDSKIDIKEELKFCSHQELAQTANQISANYEESRNFEESSTFRYLAMQSKRYEYYFHGWFYTLNWLYWLSSGYGEKRFRAALILVAIIVLFGTIYISPLSCFDYGENRLEKSDNQVEQQIFGVANYAERFHSMNWDEGVVYSLSVAAFQRPDPKAADTKTKLFVFLESILAPLQAALLALAIRRKFMR